MTGRQPSRYSGSASCFTRLSATCLLVTCLASWSTTAEPPRPSERGAQEGVLQQPTHCSPTCTEGTGWHQSAAWHRVGLAWVLGVGVEGAARLQQPACPLLMCTTTPAPAHTAGMHRRQHLSGVEQTVCVHDVCAWVVRHAVQVGRGTAGISGGCPQLPATCCARLPACGCTAHSLPAPP